MNATSDEESTQAKKAQDQEQQQRHRQQESLAFVTEDGQAFPIGNQPLTIGRFDCNISLPEDEMVSRHHATVQWHDNKLSIIDNQRDRHAHRGSQTGSGDSDG